MVPAKGKKAEESEKGGAHVGMEQLLLPVAVHSVLQVGSHKGQDEKDPLQAC